MSEQYNARTAVVVAQSDLHRHLMTLEGAGQAVIELDDLWKRLIPLNAAIAHLQDEETRSAA